MSCSTRRRTTPSFFLLLCISFLSQKDLMAAEATSYPLLWCRLPMDCSPWENMDIIGYLWAAALLAHPSALTQIFPGWNEGIAPPWSASSCSQPDVPSAFSHSFCSHLLCLSDILCLAKGQLRLAVSCALQGLTLLLNPHHKYST